jgi:hypothetical protein
MSVTEDTPKEKIIEQVGRVICAYQSSAKSLYDFSAEELSFFPLEYLKSHVNTAELSGIWHRLPESYRHDRELQLNLPCHVHHNIRWHQLDGPPLAIRRCCKYKEK